MTRSTVQKAVVVLASKPVFGPIRDRLGVVTLALFEQKSASPLSRLRLADDVQGTSLTPIYSSSFMSRFRVLCGVSSQRVGFIWV
jgi:Transport protein Avl9